MDKNKDILKDFFKEKLKDYEHPVKRDLWSSLESHVPTEKTLWRRIYPVVVSVAAIVVAMVLLYSYLFRDTPDMEETVASKTTESVQNIQVEPDKGKDDERAEMVEEDIVIQKNERATEKLKVPDSEVQRIVAEISSEKENQATAEPESATKKESSVAESPKNGQKYPENLFPEKTPGLRISISGEGFLAMNNELDYLKIYNSDYLNTYENQFAMNDLFPDDEEGTDSGSPSPHPGLPPDYTLVSIKYDTPVSLGLFFSKNISPRWAIETGINYTRLSSEEIWKGEKEQYTDYLTSDIKLHYLGIPLRASYSFIKKERFSVYVTGGGMIEKCISGKAVTVSKNERVEKKTNLDIPELQFSVTGSAGVGYRLFKSVSLFVEPGVVYYFDDGSNMMTIRKDKPFNFSIQGGLRFSF